MDLDEEGEVRSANARLRASGFGGGLDEVGLDDVMKFETLSLCSPCKG